MFCLIVLTAVVAYCVSGETDALKFLVVGDWGGIDTSPYYTPAQLHVANQMGKTAEEIGAEFTVTVGDNFYTQGVQNVDDPRFKETYEDVFTAGSLQSRWYVIVGNHDHYGNASAQIAYTAKSDRWYMPDYYYTEIVTIKGTSTKVQFVFIDTIILSGLTHPTKKWIPPSGPASVNAAEDHWTWIEKMLATSTAQWRFVVGHYPVWSIAEHGPTQILVDRLRPMLIKYNVTAYICGHDHDMQHLREKNRSVEYFVIGAGHDTNPSEAHINDIEPVSLLYHYGMIDFSSFYGAFSWFSISSTGMNVTYVDKNGKQLYTYTKGTS